MSTTTPEWLYRVTPSRLAMLTEGPTASEQEAVGAHFAYLQRLLAEGSLILAGRTTNADATTFGIAIFRAPTEEDARRIVDDDPAVRLGVMHAELFPYRVALIERPVTSA